MNSSRIAMLATILLGCMFANPIDATGGCGSDHNSPCPGRRKLLAEGDQVTAPWRTAYASVDPAVIGCGDFQELLHDQLVDISFTGFPDVPLPTADAIELVNVGNVTAYLSTPGKPTTMTAAVIEETVTGLSFCPVPGDYAVEYLLSFNSVTSIVDNNIDDAEAEQLACLLGKTFPVFLAHGQAFLPDSVAASNGTALIWRALVADSLE